jgi:hypothetical protein
MKICSLRLSVAVLAASGLCMAGTLSAQTAASPSASPSTAPSVAAVSPSPSPAASAKPENAKPPKDRAVRKEILERYDTNKNGLLDPDERAVFEKEAPLRKAERLQKYDKNNDGKIDDAERVQMRVDRLREQDAAAKKAKP